MSSSKPVNNCGKKGQKEQCSASKRNVSGTRGTATGATPSAALCGGKSVTKIRIGGIGRGQQTSSIIVCGTGLQPGPLNITPQGPLTISNEENKSKSSLSQRQGAISAPNAEDKFSIKEGILIQEGQFTQGNEDYDVTIIEEEAIIQGSPGIDLLRASPKEWYEEDEFNISPLKSDYGDLSSDATADLSPPIEIDFNYVPYADVEFSDSSPVSFDDDYGLGISPPSSPDRTPPLFSSPQYESPSDADSASPTRRSPSPTRRSPSPLIGQPSPRETRSSREVEVQTGLSVPRRSSPSKIPSGIKPPSMNTSKKDTSTCSSKEKKSKTPDKSPRKARRRSVGTSVSPKYSKVKSPTQDSRGPGEVQIHFPNTLITQPEIFEHQEEHDVAPLEMDSPVGRIEAITSLKMSRQTVGSPKGTVIDHSFVGTKTVSPGKAKQIEMTKKELIPPSPERRRIDPSNRLPAVRSGIRQPSAVGLRPPGAGASRPSGIRPPSTFGSGASSINSSTCDVTSSHTSSPRMASPRMQYTAAVSPVEDVGQGVLPPEVALDRPTISSPRMQGPTAPRVIQAPRQIPSVGAGSRLQTRTSGIRPPSQQSSKRASPSRDYLPEPRRVPVGQYSIPARSGVNANSPEMLKQKLTKSTPISLVNWKNEMQNYNQTFNATLQEQETLDPSLPEAFWSSSMKEAMALAEEADLPVISSSVTAWDTDLPSSTRMSPQRSSPARVPVTSAGPALRPPSGRHVPSRMRPPTGMRPPGFQAPSGLRPPSGMRQPTGMRPTGVLRSPIASGRRSTSPQSSTCGVTCPSNAREPTPPRTPTPQSVSSESGSARSPSPPGKEWYEEDEYNISSLKSFSDGSGVSSVDALSPNYDINLDYSLYANMNFSDGSIPGSLDDTDEDVSALNEDDLAFSLGLSEDEEEMVSPTSPRAIAQRMPSPPYVESRISPAQPQYSTQGRMAPAQYAQPRWLPAPQTACVSPRPSSGRPSPLGQISTVVTTPPPDEPNLTKSSMKSSKKKSGSKLCVRTSKTSKAPSAKKGKKSSPSKTSVKMSKSTPKDSKRESRAVRRPCSEGVDSAQHRTTSERAASAPARPYITAPSKDSDLYEADDELSQSVVEPSLLSRFITTQPYSPKSPPSPINLEVSIKVPKSARGADASIVKKLVDEEREEAMVCKMLMSPLKDKLGKHKKKPQAVKLLEETMSQSIPGDDESDSFRSDIMAALLATEEKGKIDATKSPKRTYETLFPPLQDEPVLAVSPAGPAPLQDIVVPVGDADMEDIAIVNDEIRSTCASQIVTEMPSADLYAESMARMNAKEKKKLATNEKDKEKQRLEMRKRSTIKASASQKEDEPYIPRGDLEEERAPWEINLDDLEDIVGGQMSTLQEDLPSDESIRATKGRLEYILEYEKPMHYSCVQLQGSQSPNWFPGYYSVFPHTPNFVRLEKSPSRVMHVAWNIFAPSDVLDNSEVIIS